MKEIDIHPIHGFKDEFDFLSNFYVSEVLYEGVLYQSSEHAFQAAKTLDTKLRMKISAADTPSRAKKLGRQLEIRPDWEEVKITVMEHVVRSKFKRNRWIAQKLINTGSRHLLEGNSWHDNTWGNCFCHQCESITGKNLLGVLLMEERALLKNGIYDFMNFYTVARDL